MTGNLSTECFPWQLIPILYDWQSVHWVLSLTTNPNTIYLTIHPLCDLPGNQYQYCMTGNPSSVWSSWQSTPILYDWQSVHWVIFLATNTNTVWLAICALCDLPGNQSQYYMTGNLSTEWSSWQLIPILYDWQSVLCVIFLAINPNTIWLAICPLSDPPDN